MNLPFSNKNVLVTGGTRGIGKSISTAFLNAGANVYVTGRSQSVPNDVDSRATYHQLDFSCEGSVNRFLSNIIANMKFDILVNNAGINIINDLNDIKYADFCLVNTVNLKGPFLISSNVAANMSHGGRIVNVASIWSVITKKGRISYTSAKSGLLGLTRALAVDLADRGILVNAVSPGFVETELTKNSLSKSEMAALQLQVPMGRLAQPLEVAECVLFLCGPQNSFITGQNIVIDGGFSCV